MTTNRAITRGIFTLYRSLKIVLAVPAAALGLPANSCRHTPSCSRYCQQVIMNKGWVRGSLPCLTRLLSCRPGGKWQGKTAWFSIPLKSKK